MHISSRGFTRESWCKRVVNKLSQLLKIQDCPFDFISNTIQTQIYQQTRLQAQILFIFAYIVLHFHISYMCNLYIGIFFFIFFILWNYTRESYVHMRVILHISILYNTREKWKSHLSQRPLILLPGLLWLGGIVWFCLQEEIWT